MTRPACSAAGTCRPCASRCGSRTSAPQQREITVTERIPISEVEQVDVQVVGARRVSARHDDQPGGEEITQVTARALDEQGLVTWAVELPPLGRRAVTLEYKIKSQRGVAGVVMMCHRRDVREPRAKNARHLGKWAKREGVTCWRVYDRDIPEVPVTLDTYEGALVLNDYRIDASATPAGSTSSPRREARARRDARCSSSSASGFAHRGEGDQYERQAERGAWRTVREGGHAFRVNLSDYIDTGLFLDHRITRAKAAAEPAHAMLNLFCYTGAFWSTAPRPAWQTTSVDLSKTYLDWARENLALNKLDGEIVHADVREFLAEARRAGRRWDLIVVDPPTFSNSKRMDYTWDVQRDHAALLDDVAAVTTKVIWFSTNLRRFKLEWSHPRAQVTDETTRRSRRTFATSASITRSASRSELLESTDAKSTVGRVLRVGRELSGWAEVYQCRGCHTAIDKPAFTATPPSCSPKRRR